MPLSQLIQRSPLVRKQATACLARWWIQPSCLSWVMMASIQGKPVRPSAHLASASGFWSHGICWHIRCRTWEPVTIYNRLCSNEIFQKAFKIYCITTISQSSFQFNSIAIHLCGSSISSYIVTSSAAAWCTSTGFVTDVFCRCSNSSNPFFVTETDFRHSVVVAH